ncbi:MAG: molybdopterin-binding protein [Pseudomonadota bacterium]
MSKSSPTAAIVLIGDEILSGRTRDINLQQIATFLAPLGIPVQECRTVQDEQDEIVDAVNALRRRYTYVFTTGGIGPTHDDITADAIAVAFGIGISEHPTALKILEERYAAANMDFTPARRRMARIPDGADLIDNPVSGAPGFQTENVFTLAGVPAIVQGMLQSLEDRLETGVVVHSVTIQGPGGIEGDIAEALGNLATEMPSISFGSYPWFRSIDDRGVNLIARGTDLAALDAAAERLLAIFLAAGVAAKRLPIGDD